MSGDKCIERRQEERDRGRKLSRGNIDFAAGRTPRPDIQNQPSSISEKKAIVTAQALERWTEIKAKYSGVYTTIRTIDGSTRPRKSAAKWDAIKKLQQINIEAHMFFHDPKDSHYFYGYLNPKEKNKFRSEFDRGIKTVDDYLDEESEGFRRKQLDRNERVVEFAYEYSALLKSIRNIRKDILNVSESKGIDFLSDAERCLQEQQIDVADSKKVWDIARKTLPRHSESEVEREKNDELFVKCVEDAYSVRHFLLDYKKAAMSYEKDMERVVPVNTQEIKRREEEKALERSAVVMQEFIKLHIASAKILSPSGKPPAVDELQKTIEGFETEFKTVIEKSGGLPFKCSWAVE